MSTATLLSSLEAAKIAGVTAGNLRMWIRLGAHGHKLPGMRVGKGFIIDRNDLLQFLKRIDREPVK